MTGLSPAPGNTQRRRQYSQIKHEELGKEFHLTDQRHWYKDTQFTDMTLSCSSHYVGKEQMTSQL